MKTRQLFLAAACCLLTSPVSMARPGAPQPTPAQLLIYRGPIYGYVRDSQGAPIPGAVVTLRSIRFFRHGRNLPPIETTTTTSDDGRYAFRQMPTGKYRLTVRARLDAAPVEREFEHWESPQHSSRPPVRTQVDINLGVGPPTTPTPRPTPQPTPTSSPRPTPTPAPPRTPTPAPTRTPNSLPTPVLIDDPGATPTPAGTPQSRIDEILGGMDHGNIAFNVPPSMSLEKAETVILLLSPKHAVAELEQRLRDEGAVGDVKDARIKIHDRMQAVLTGDGFEVTDITEHTLPVSKQEPTQWKWDVRAKRAGTLKLNVVLNAIVDLDDGTGPRPYPIRTFSKTYLVEVPRQQGAVVTFFKNNWPWLFTALLIPAGAWVWHRRRRKRRVFAAGEGAGIFISYRREDAAGHVGRLRDALVAHFGPERVFMDIDSIGYGEDFVEAIERAVGSSAVVVVVIGRQWVSVTDKTGGRRLDSPRDFVRQEIAAALGRGVKIIPVLVEGAAMPAEDALPAALSQLARRNAIELSDTRWQSDVERLIEALEGELSKKESLP